MKKERWTEEWLAEKRAAVATVAWWAFMGVVVCYLVAWAAGWFGGEW